MAATPIPPHSINLVIPYPSHAVGAHHIATGHTDLRARNFIKTTRPTRAMRGRGAHYKKNLIQWIHDGNYVKQQAENAAKRRSEVHEFYRNLRAQQVATNKARRDEAEKVIYGILDGLATGRFTGDAQKLAAQQLYTRERKNRDAAQPTRALVQRSMTRLFLRNDNPGEC